MRSHISTRQVTNSFHSQPHYKWNASHLKRWCENMKWYSPLNENDLILVCFIIILITYNNFSFLLKNSNVTVAVFQFCFVCINFNGYEIILTSVFTYVSVRIYNVLTFEIFNYNK